MINGVILNNFVQKIKQLNMAECRVITGTY